MSPALRLSAPRVPGGSATAWVVDRAEPWRRAGSWAIDLGLVGVAVAVATAIHGLLGALVLVVGVPAYYLMTVAVHGGGTLGHRLMGIRVIDDRTAEVVGLEQAALRLGVIVTLIVPFAVPAVISATRLVRTGDRRTWHDMATQSVVTRVSVR